MRKQGKKHSRKIVKPLGVKGIDFELANLTSLTAMQAGTMTDDHNVNFWVLADICAKFEPQGHIAAHCDTVKRMCEELHQASYDRPERWYTAMRASSTILLEFIKMQDNGRVYDIAMDAIRGIK